MSNKLLKELEGGTKQAVMRKKIITHYIYNGTSTITELAKELHLSVPTVTKFIDEMCTEGYLNDYGKLETAGGRHPSLYGLNPDSGYFMGVELCATEVNIGVINFKGDMVHVKRHIPFVSSNTLQSLDEFCGIIKEFMDEVTLDKEKLLNINVNLIGRVNSDLGYSYSVFNLSERPLTEILSEKLGGFRVSIDNDTRAMAYGEFMQGIVRNEKNVLFINVSWGLAAGIIIDGKMYKGRSGFSGEFGHNYGYDNEILCHCGKKGCIETEASGLALHRILLEQLAKGKSSIIQQMKEDVSQITLDDIIEAVEREDMLCIELVEELGMKLGTHIAGLVNIFNPEMVVIGGLLSQTGDYLIQPIASTLRKYTLNLMIYDSFIVQSKLKDKAGIVGACMVARSRLFE
jgi:predicted NBD/HSP70 family sugar kinase